MDKNLWATTVWNSWDTLSEANCWKYYQRWNNYWFPRTWTVTTSSTQVDASTYWPWNYYSSNTFIIYSWAWDSTGNGNLWWWVTWVVTLDNVISNTGVLSVNGQTWNVTIPTPEESNTKTFYLSSTSDTTNAQKAHDWLVAWNIAVLYYSWDLYYQTTKLDNYAQSHTVYFASTRSWIFTRYIVIWCNNTTSTVTSISQQDIYVTKAWTLNTQVNLSTSTPASWTANTVVTIVY